MTSDPARMPNLDIAHLLDEIAELAPEQVPDAVASQAAPLIDAAAAVQQALLERVQRAPSLAFRVLGAWLQNVAAQPGHVGI